MVTRSKKVGKKCIYIYEGHVRKPKKKGKWGIFPYKKTKSQFYPNKSLNRMLVQCEF